MNVKIHEKYIKRCIEIAKNGLGYTAPNPMVGCVIVHNNSIIGEGYTSAYGGNHAEINAMNSVRDRSLLKSSILYVTLEPCSHHGKTPPCADAIINSLIHKVVIGTMDSHTKVAGQGIEKLKSAGCEVIVGVLEDECKQHHQRFFTFHKKERPYIILKWAQSQDGFIAPKTKKEKKPIWITNEISRQLVHKWRADEQAILVGTTTVLEDNPSLTVRDWVGKNPIRVVVDKEEKLSKKLNVFDNATNTLKISKNTIDFSNPFAQEICSFLYQNEINSVIIEGGNKTLQTFIDENLWDEARVFTGTENFNDGVKAPSLIARVESKINILNDVLTVYLNNAV